MVITLATKSVCIHSGNPLRGPHFWVRHRNTLDRGQLVHDAKELVLPLGLYIFAHKKWHRKNGLKGYGGLCLLGKTFLQSLSSGTISPWSRPVHCSPSHAEHIQMRAVPEGRAYRKGSTWDKTCRPQPLCAPHPRKIGTCFPNAATQLRFPTLQPHHAIRPCSSACFHYMSRAGVDTRRVSHAFQGMVPQAFGQEGIHTCCLLWVLGPPNSHSSRAQKQSSTHQQESATGGSLLLCWVASRHDRPQQPAGAAAAALKEPRPHQKAQRAAGLPSGRRESADPPGPAAPPCGRRRFLQSRARRAGAPPTGGRVRSEPCRLPARPGPAPSPPAASGRASRRLLAAACPGGARRWGRGGILHNEGD